MHGALDKLPIIGIAVSSSEDLAIAAFRSGCRGNLKFPYAPEELSAAIERCLAAATPRGASSSSAAASGAAGRMGASAAMRAVQSYIEKVATSPSTVLITGETGTGKELAAELLHRGSGSGAKPFITVNCAAIPDTLIESELFGCEKGAFTGAVRSSGGKLHLAADGVIFFDEVGDMSPFAQTKILRAIESREVYPLGGRASYQVRCRFIAATNCDLERHVAEGRFRKDLYYRLNVARIRLPALRERRSDIPALCRHFIAGFNRQFACDVEWCNDEVMDSLFQYDWPGNLRELRNVLEAAYLNQPTRFISLSNLPEWFREATGAEAPVQEHNRVFNALVHSNWNKRKAAETLRLPRMTLYRKMSKYSIGLNTPAPARIIPLILKILPINVGQSALFYREAI